MDDFKTLKETETSLDRPSISAEEAERRRTHVRVAIAENRIEGIATSAEAQGVFDSYVRGEIEASELVTAYQKAPQPGS